MIFFSLEIGTFKTQVVPSLQLINKNFTHKSKLQKKTLRQMRWTFRFQGESCPWRLETCSPKSLVANASPREKESDAFCLLFVSAVKQAIHKQFALLSKLVTIAILSYGNIPRVESFWCQFQKPAAMLSNFEDLARTDND